ncbi:TolC family protein [uncultured Cytophaga sp.]|uniref:TolC family protein n=1 Tax=uncultured Cytophaga sp. TaxID=160238 RepID=UPI002627BDCF|nr:TolC family protein [uncultured Cytophaga sp.]
MIHQTIIMHKTYLYKFIGIAILTIAVWACTPTLTKKSVNDNLPSKYTNLADSTHLNSAQSSDTLNTVDVSWKKYFKDENLVALIDTALQNNQELNIILYEINVAQAEVRARKGQYLPYVDGGVGAGVEKAGKYTRTGAVDDNLDIQNGKRIPTVLPNYVVGVNLSWEVDIWKKLRNAKKAAVLRYLASVEGRNFMITNIVAEIGSTYYELLALDKKLEILKKNIEIQSNALSIVRMEKQSAKVTELAVRRFEAQVLYTRSLQFKIQQEIVEAENHLNFLIGSYPKPIKRNPATFIDIVHDSIYAGVPSQLLSNRWDIKKAEHNLEASKLDVKVAKANFYPTFRITSGIGLEAFNPKLVISSPESMLFSLAGTFVGPLINRNEIKAMYLTANAKQLQAAYNYERTILNAFIEVSNQMAKISNLGKSFELQDQQVEALNESVNIANKLFISARADYMEVLLTQRDALESKMELVETKKEQLKATVYFYRALGGG